MNIQLPEKVKEIIDGLNAAGFEAYAVGGCIRDSLTGRRPDDWDITTSAKPEQVKKLFPRTVDTGIQHGTVTVLLGRDGFEVTTYRIDGAYMDGRHPSEVTFTASLFEDLKRRDFTINAMAYNEREGLIDIFGGVRDISQKLIRCVGRAQERFTEDALRMMRAVRFSAQLGYEIDGPTREAISVLSQSLSKISAERIRTELVKLVTSEHPEKIRICHETGMTGVFLPEFDRMMETEQNNPHHIYSVGEHAVQTMVQIRNSQVMRLAALFHDAGKPLTKTTDEDGIDHFYGHSARSAEITECVMRRLKFDNETQNRVARLVRYHDVDVIPEPEYMRRAMNRIGDDLMPELFELKQADMEAQSGFMRKDKEALLSRLRALHSAVRQEGCCVTLKSLAVTGNDLIAAGMKPGKQIGVVLSRMLDLILEEPSRNKKDYLMSRLDSLREEGPAGNV